MHYSSDAEYFEITQFVSYEIDVSMWDDFCIIIYYNN